MVVGRAISAPDAIKKLTQDRPPVALLLTANGRRHEAILGLLVHADVPAMRKALQLGYPMLSWAW